MKVAMEKSSFPFNNAVNETSECTISPKINLYEIRKGLKIKIGKISKSNLTKSTNVQNLSSNSINN
jgi:hypothetical protein